MFCIAAELQANQERWAIVIWWWYQQLAAELLPRHVTPQIWKNNASYEGNCNFPAIKCILYFRSKELQLSAAKAMFSKKIKIFRWSNYNSFHDIDYWNFVISYAPLPIILRPSLGTTVLGPLLFCYILLIYCWHQISSLHCLRMMPICSYFIKIWNH